ncbi:MAG: hypothetical protein ACRDUB_24030, partial [Mycobacterium sp.]
RAVQATDQVGRIAKLTPNDFGITQDPFIVPLPGLSGGQLTGVSLSYDHERRVVAAAAGATDACVPTWTLSYPGEQRRPNGLVPPTAAGSVAQTITYTPADPLQPITAATISGVFGGTTSYVIDPASGCWTSCSVPGVVAVTTSRTVNATNRQMTPEITGRVNTTFTYDAQGNLTGRTVTGGTQVQSTWGDGGIDGANLLLSTSVVGGATTTMTYVPSGAAAGQVLTRTSTDSGSEQFTYTGAGWLSTRVDARSKTWTYQDHDTYGNPRTILHPVAGRQTTRTYADSGQRGWLASETTFLNQTTAWTYDAQGRVASTTLPSGGVQSDSRDALGNV